MSDASSSVWKLDDVGEPSETVFADVVVIGGGGTGMAATIQASELGLDVVLLEKAENWEARSPLPKACSASDRTGKRRPGSTAP